MKVGLRNLCTIVCALLSFLATASGFGTDPLRFQSAQQAEALWEQAISAKGGREQLNQVNSLLISYQETSRNFLGVAVHRGYVERLYVFPSKSWGWDDGLPPPFHLSVGWLNLEQNRRCTIYAGAPAPTCAATQAGTSHLDEGLHQVQYLYLMETRWVKPVPLSLTATRLGSHRVDVLRTRFENKTIDYFLDRKTHLPKRVEVFYDGSTRATLKVDLGNYLTVGGIRMPSRQKRGTINFQINPPYDEGIFNRPPSIAAGPKAWRRQ